MGRPRRGFELIEDVSMNTKRAAKPGDRRSFNLNTQSLEKRMRVRTTFNSRARGRGGKMKLRSIVLLFASLLLISTFPAYGQNPNTTTTTSIPANDQHTGSISGTVFDPDGRAVAGSQITLLYAMAALEVRETNAQGQYRFDELRAGTYEIVGASPGFNEVTGDIELHADEKLMKDLKLSLSAVQEKIVVSAAPGGVLTSQIASAVSVVSAEEIDDRGAEAALDVMRGLPGVEINQSGGRGTVTSAFIRGGNSNYNLVMVNGIQLNDFGGGFDLAPLPAEGVEQIEVIRGPESALYGSNAVAGVINIETIHGDGPPHFSFVGEAGSLYTWRLGTTGAGLNRGFSWAYSLSRLQTRGQIQNDGYRNQTSTVSLGYSRSPRRQFNVNFFGDAGAVGLPGPWGSDPDGLFPGRDPASHQNQNLFGYQAQYVEQFSSRFQQVSTVSVSTDRITFISPSEGNSFTNNLRVVANTRSEIAVSSKDTLVAGFEYDRDQFKNAFVEDPSDLPFVLGRNSYAFFAENRWNPGERWYINAGLRVDDIQTNSVPLNMDTGQPGIPSNSLVKVTPRLSAAYLARESDDGGFFGATRLHASFGTGFRAPDGFELAFTNNPDLKPEQSISFDTGIEQRMARDKAVIDVTYFYNRFKDQIVTTGDLPTNFDSENIAKSRANGLETTIRLRPISSLEFSGSYTWLNTAILALDGFNEPQTPFAVGEPLIRRPHNAAGFNATWTERRLMLNMNGTIRGAVLDVEPNDGTFACESTNPMTGNPFQCLFRNHGYQLLNAGFAYRLPKGIEIFGRLNNFLNQKYEEAFGFPSLRLNFMAGFKIDLPSGGWHSE
jgi:outer membrane receptor protein involved in Fe transport